MAARKSTGIYPRKNADGSLTYVAQVRIKPYLPASKSFCEADYPSWREARQAAEAWAAETKRTLSDQQRKRRSVRADVARLLVRDIATEYLDDPKTHELRGYDKRKQQIAWWMHHYGTVRALEFASPVWLRDARKRLQGEGLKPATINRYLAAGRKLNNFAVNAGLLDTSCVWPKGLMLTEPKGRTRYLSAAELSKLLTEARKDSPVMHAAVLFAIGVGCRQGDQLAVRWSDIDGAAGVVAIGGAKTAEPHRPHLPAAVFEALQGLRRGKVTPLPTQPVFPIDRFQLAARWEKVRAAAGLPDLRWHDLRHSCASFLINGGASLAEIAHQLGHASVITTRRYAHLVPGRAPTGADALNEKLRG